MIFPPGELPVSSRSAIALLFFTLIGGLAAVQALPAESDRSAGSSPRRVLIVTGEDYKGHEWRETAPVLQRLLAKDPRLAVEISEDLKSLCLPRLHDYDALVLHFKNYDPHVPGPEAHANLDRFVREGGGLVLVHFACGAFQEWPEFAALAGRIWNPKMRGHDPRGKFRVEIVDTEHAVTRGLEAFETTDELYTCLDGDTPIQVLAQSQSKVDREQYPMAFVLQRGKGRVFHSPLGHDVTALSAPAVGELFRRGCAWVAGVEPVAPAR